MPTKLAQAFVLKVTGLSADACLTVVAVELPPQPLTADPPGVCIILATAMTSSLQGRSQASAQDQYQPDSLHVKGVER